MSGPRPENSRISIALPVYNGAAYIESALQSLLNQGEDIEIVLADDHSTDDTIPIVQRMSAQNIKILKDVKRRGQFAAFNRALRACSGDYIQLFSHDDVALNGFLASQRRVFDQDPRIGLVYASCHIINSTGDRIDRSDDDGTPLLIDFKTYLHISSRHGALPPSVSTVMIKREVIDGIGAFDEHFEVAGDLEFYNRVAKKYMLARNRSMCLEVRTHPGSVTLNSSSPLKYASEEVNILPFYAEYLSPVEFHDVMRRRERTRGALHAKHLIRDIAACRFRRAAATYRTLSKVHNVPRCIWYAVLEKVIGATNL